MSSLQQLVAASSLVLSRAQDGSGTPGASAGTPGSMTTGLPTPYTPQTPGVSQSGHNPSLGASAPTQLFRNFPFLGGRTDGVSPSSSTVPEGDSDSENQSPHFTRNRTRKTPKSSGKGGFRGVYRARDRKFKAVLRKKPLQYQLGIYNTAAEAAQGNRCGLSWFVALMCFAGSV